MTRGERLLVAILALAFILLMAWHYAHAFGRPPGTNANCRMEYPEPDG
jgi:hypothetical protein